MMNELYSPCSVKIVVTDKDGQTVTLVGDSFEWQINSTWHHVTAKFEFYGSGIALSTQPCSEPKKLVTVSE